MACVSRLNRRQRYLVHQIHPAKLTTDIAASVLSTILFWRRRPIPGMVVVLVPPVIVSALLLGRDLDRWGETAAGRYVLAHMPPSMQTVRAVSAVVTAVGAWRRSAVLLAVGYGLTVLGWSHGLLGRSTGSLDRSGRREPIGRG
jgi:hypothetical protein